MDGASLGVQWLRIHLPAQGTWVQSLVCEDPNAEERRSWCATTTKAHALRPTLCKNRNQAVRSPYTTREQPPSPQLENARA